MKTIFKGNLFQAWDSENVKMHHFSIMLDRVVCEESAHIDENYLFTMDKQKDIVWIY